VAHNHVVMRRCIGCKRVAPQTSLLRVVRTRTGQVLDGTGEHISGRSAYVCPAPGCVKAAGRRRMLERALSAAVSEEIWERLLAQAGTGTQVV
jgi:hypothetical protein